MGDITEKRWFKSTTIILFALIGMANEVFTQLHDLNPETTWVVRGLSILAIIQRIRTSLPVSR